jgi:hypothetical protein
VVVVGIPRDDGDVESRRVSGTGRRGGGDTAVAKRVVGGETVTRPTPQHTRANDEAGPSTPPGPSPRMTRAAQVLREAKALMKELSPSRNDGDVDVRHDARFEDDTVLLDVANTGGRWRSLRAPASSARARLEAEAEDSNAFVYRRRDHNRSQIFAAIAAAAPPRNGLDGDFGASRLVERTGALRAASAAAQAAAAAARGWRRPGVDALFDSTGKVTDREKIKIDEEVRKLRARLTNELKDKETHLVSAVRADEEQVAVSSKLQAANLAKEKARKEIAAAAERAAAADRRRVAANAAAVAERDAEAAFEARKAARAKAAKAEATAVEAEAHATQQQQRTQSRTKRAHFNSWRSVATDAARARSVAATRAAVKLLVRRARRAFRAWGLLAAATKAREEAAAVARAEEMETKMEDAARAWRRAKLCGAAMKGWRAVVGRRAVREAGLIETVEATLTTLTAETSETADTTETAPAAPTASTPNEPKTTNEIETQTVTPSKINWTRGASAFWGEDVAEDGARFSVSDDAHETVRFARPSIAEMIDEDEDDLSELSFEAEAADAADATRDATDAARDADDDPAGAEDIARLVELVRRAHATLLGDAPATTAPSAPRETDTHSEPYENPWAHSPPKNVARKTSPPRNTRASTKADVLSATRAAARADLRARAAFAREEAASRTAARAAEEGEIERSIAAARTAEILATRHAAAARKASARRAAVIAAESLALATAHGERTLSRRKGFDPWRSYVVFVKGATHEAFVRGVEAPMRRVFSAWTQRARLRIGRRANACARLTVVHAEYTLHVFLRKWFDTSLALKFCEACLFRRSFARWQDQHAQEKRNKLTASTFHASVLTHRAWYGWLTEASPGIEAVRVARHEQQTLRSARVALRVFAEWRIVTRRLATNKRVASEKNALFVKVGVWLEEMRGDLELSTPETGSESESRSSPTSRKARRARFYANKTSRLSPDDEPRPVGSSPKPSPKKSVTFLASNTGEANTAYEQREWSPEEMPTKVLSMPSPTPKKSPKKSPAKRKEHSPIAVRLFSFDSKENDDDWLCLADVPPPDVMHVLERERAAIGEDADRSQQRALKFVHADRNPHVPSRLAVLAKPKSPLRSPLKSPQVNPWSSPLSSPVRSPSPLKKETPSTPDRVSAGTRARLARLKATRGARKQKNSL